MVGLTGMGSGPTAAMTPADWGDVLFKIEPSVSEDCRLQKPAPSPRVLVDYAPFRAHSSVG